MSIIEPNLKSEIIWSWLDQVKNEHPTCQVLDVDSIEISKPRRAEIGASYLRVAHQLDRMIIHLAGSLIRGRELGDDSFLDFRNWLIWCGLEIVETAIENVDELYDQLAAKNFDVDFPFCENLSALGIWAPRSSNVQKPLSFEEFLGNGDEKSDGPLTAELLSTKLPKLWGRFGREFEFKQKSELSDFAEVYVNGLGTFRVGDKVFHKKGFGEGEILKIFGNEGLVLLRFAHGEMTFWLNPEFIERMEQ